jgi:DNA (cytosine-5)-methyltransferase 3A
MADPAAAGSGSGAVVPMGGTSEDWTPSFGDMVWGKVKSHPWWPGHVYSITLSDDPEVHRGHRHGLVLVAFFGDGSYGWFEPHELVRFEDHFVEKTSQGGSRTFPAAVAESLDEIARRSALALLCPCRGPDTFRPHKEDAGILLVNVPGFDSNAEYLPDQVTAARDKFVPQTMLDFLQSAAVGQRDAAETAARTLPGIEMAAMLMAYRRTRFEKYDLTYAESFGVEPKKALEGEIKAEAERSQRGIDTHMPKPSSITIQFPVIVFALYLNLMVKRCYCWCWYRLHNTESFDVNNKVDFVGSNSVCFSFVQLLAA